MLSGTVVSGEKVGRKLGYPTANIKLEYDYPLDGVYLTRTVIKEKNYVGLASLGNKPTFNGSEKILEVFILDFDEDIYSCLLYTSPSPRDHQPSGMPSSA